MTSSRGPGKPSPESSEDTGKNLQIWELERQLAQLRGPTPTGKAKSKSGTKGTPILDFLQPTPKPSKVKNQQSRKSKPVPFPAPSGYESEDSLAPHPVAPAPTKYWYGIAFGKYNRSGVFEDKAEVRSLIQDGTKYIRGQNPEEVWDFVHFHTSEGPGAHYPGYGIPTPPAAPKWPHRGFSLCQLHSRHLNSNSGLHFSFTTRTSLPRSRKRSSVSAWMSTARN